MTNFEKYKDEILKITESNSNLAKKDGVVVACAHLTCKDCDFDGMDECGKNQFKWLYEDDGEEHDGCDGCKYEYKGEDESPCTECCNNYTSKWKRRPKKTRQDEFSEHYPNVRKRRCNGVIDICPKDLNMRFNCRLSEGCEICRRDYWLQEVEE